MNSHFPSAASRPQSCVQRQRNLRCNSASKCADGFLSITHLFTRCMIMSHKCFLCGILARPLWGSNVETTKDNSRYCLVSDTDSVWLFGFQTEIKPSGGEDVWALSCDFKMFDKSITFTVPRHSESLQAESHCLVSHWLKRECKQWVWWLFILSKDFRVCSNTRFSRGPTPQYGHVINKQ